MRVWGDPLRGLFLYGKINILIINNHQCDVKLVGQPFSIMIIALEYRMTRALHCSYIIHITLAGHAHLLFSIKPNKVTKNTSSR